jgi:hypothetical protein
MDKWRRFSRMSWARKRDLVLAAGIGALVGIGVRRMPFGGVRYAVLKFSKMHRAGRGSPQRAAEIVHAVRIAGRVIGRATCLTRALSAKLLMSWEGLDADLKIGIARDADGRLISHAWVEHEGRIVPGQAGDPSLYRHYFLLDRSEERSVEPA